MKNISMLLFILPAFVVAAENYETPKLSLEHSKSYEKIEVQKQKWVEPNRLHSEKDVERKIASEPGRKPSSAKENLFKPWIYKKYKIVP